MSEVFYNVDGKAVRKEELFNEIIRMHKMDRTKAREMVYLNGISWHELAMYQLAKKGER